MPGLPAAPQNLPPMLSPETLGGTAALVIGTGLEAEAARAGLSESGAKVSSLATISAADVSQAIAGSGAEILVLCSRLMRPALATQMPLLAWREGPGRELEMSLAALAAFGEARAEKGGAALLMVDPVAFLGGPGVTAGAGAQAALVNMAQSLGVEWAPQDIRVNALAVGRFAGKEGSGGPGNVPALRLGEARELAWMVAYLCSPFAAYVTGTCVTIDGGDSLKRYLLEPRYKQDEFLGTTLADGGTSPVLSDENVVRADIGSSEA